MSTITSIGRTVFVFHIVFFIVSLILLGSGVSSSQVGSGSFQYSVVVTIATIVVSLTAIGIAIALIGIQGLASGLNDTSTFSIQRLVVFGAIWAILSGVTFQIFNLLAVLGIVIYTILSIFFAIYVFVGGSDN